MAKIEAIELDSDVGEGIRILSRLVGDKFFLVGAAARDILLTMHKINPERATRDVDFAVRIESWQVYDTLRMELIRHGFKDYPSPHIFSFKAARFDIIPFGEITSNKSQILWPQDGRVMNLMGFEEAFTTSHTFLTSQNVKIRIASLAGLVMLKIIAWKDRPAERVQDPIDISTILRNYFDAGNIERFYDEHSDLVDRTPFTIERAGAALLGRDLKRIGSKRTLASMKSILQAELLAAEDSLFFQQMSSTYDYDSQVEMIRLMLNEC